MLDLERIDIASDFDAIYNKEIDEAKASGKYQRLVVIVPKQSSHTVEQIIACHLGGVGFNGVEVMTFRQVIRTFVNRDEDTYLDTTGLNLLTYRAMYDKLDECGVFLSSVNKPGFICDAQNMISELLRYGIRPSQLSEFSKSSDNKLLCAKIESFSKIYESYNTLFKERGFSTAEDDTALACKSIIDGDYFKNTKVWFSLFTDLVPQELSIIEAIVMAGADVCVHLFAPPTEDSSTSAFKSVEKIEDMLVELANRRNVPIAHTTEYSKPVGISPDLEFLRNNYFNNKTTTLTDDKHLVITSHTALFDEVVNTAKTIESLVRGDGKYRYGDIGVICANFDTYAPIIKTIFNQFDIPIFSDYKESVLSHPVAILMRSVFDVMESNYQTSDMVRLLRSGLVLNDSDVDRIDTFVTANGIRRNMWWDEQFWEKKKNYSRTDEQAQEIELVPEWALTRSFAEALLRLEERTRRMATPREHTEALFDFFDDINLHKNITSQIDKLKNEDRNDAAYLSKVWNELIKLCEQICVVLSDIKCTFLDYGMYVNMGLASLAISLIPQGVDLVSVSSFGKTSGEPVKVLFLLGATRDGLSSIPSNNVIFTDRERKELDEGGLRMAAYGVQAINEQKLTTYRTLIRASHRLIVSYPTTNEDGSTFMCAPLVEELQAKFKSLNRKNGDTIWDGVTSPSATAHTLLSKTTKAGYKDKTWLAVAEWFRTNDYPVIERFDIARGNLYKRDSDILLGDYAKELYPEESFYSISKIQAYFDCPYKYFLQSGLRLKEREVYEVGARDIGTIVHECIEKYCKAVDGNSSTPKQKKANWDALTEAESERIVDEVMETAQGSLRQSAHNQRILGRVKKIVSRSVKVINQEFKLGSFVSGGYEWEFDDFKFADSEHTVTFHGIVDRYDVYQSPTTGKTYIRIFDYKTGRKTYSETNIGKLMDIQLVVYALAVAQDIRAKNNTDCDVAGIFYEKTKNEYSKVEIDEINNDGETGKGDLSGAIFYEFVESKQPNMELLNAFDNDIANSPLYNVKFTQKGAVNGNCRGARNNEYFDYFGRWIQAKVLEADKAIKGGDIRMYPYAETASHDKTACDHYCPYKDICDNCYTRDINYREASEYSKLNDIKEYFGEA